MSNEIKLGEAILKSDDCYAIRVHGGSLRLVFDAGKFNTSVADIDVVQFDWLREFVLNQRVVEHYDSLRKPRYENGCTGDPVLVPGSFRTERNKP